MSAPETQPQPEAEAREFAAPACSAASLKAEICTLKEKWWKRWWHDRPNNGAIQELIVVLEKIIVVIESVERKLPPNDPS